MEAFLLKLASSAGGTGVAIAALYFVFRFLQNRKNNKQADPGPITTPATGMPVLGGTNPAAGEISGVVADPLKQPLSVGEHQTLCKATQATINGELNQINSKLADTGDQLRKVTTKLEAIHTDVAVLKDRADR